MTVCCRCTGSCIHGDRVIPKTIKKWYKLPPCMARNALGLKFGSAARLSKMPVSVWNCQWGHALKRYPGINRKSRVSYLGPGFLSSATWPSLPKKELLWIKPNQTKCIHGDGIISMTICCRSTGSCIHGDGIISIIICCRCTGFCIHGDGNISMTVCCRCT